MASVWKPSYLVRLSVLALVAAVCALAQVSVLNVNYDKDQTGANLQETVLQPGITWTNFGKVGTYAVDGQVYAQPLYVPGVTIAGHSYNVVYVATMHNSVYAFDADTPQVATPLWQVNFGPSVPSGQYNFNDILPEIGVLGTPVIDAVDQVLYVVSNTLSPGESSEPIFQLHAISLVDGHELLRTDGHELVGAPVLIAATVPGTGAGSNNGSVPFDATQQLQRPGLMLANGMVYVGFGSHADAGNYHGWLMAYEAATLKLKAVFNSSPNGRQSAIWQTGRAPAIGGNGDVYAVTGNGDFDGQVNFGESVLHLCGRRSLAEGLVCAGRMEQFKRPGSGHGIHWRNLDPEYEPSLVGWKSGKVVSGSCELHGSPRARHHQYRPEHPSEFVGCLRHGAVAPSHSHRL